MGINKPSSQGCLRKLIIGAKQFISLTPANWNPDTYKDQKQAPSSFEECLVSIRRQGKCKIELLIWREIKDAFPVHTHMTHP